MCPVLMVTFGQMGYDKLRKPIKNMMRIALKRVSVGSIKT